jgi:hypothetical protein
MRFHVGKFPTWNLQGNRRHEIHGRRSSGDEMSADVGAEELLKGHANSTAPRLQTLEAG